MIEQNTEYSQELKQIAYPCFDEILKLTLRIGYKDDSDVFGSLKRGTAILNKESQLICYMRTYGKMHKAKLEYAFGYLSNAFLDQSRISIIDYGCGQGFGTICYRDYNDYYDLQQYIKKVTLIEPSKKCLKRAALNVSVLVPNAKIKTVNKKFDDLTLDDIVDKEAEVTLHILSNVLDITDFDLNKFVELIKDSLTGFNQFVCVGPFFMNERDSRIDVFSDMFKGNNCYEEELERNELRYDKDWTCKLSVFTVGETTC